MISCSNVEAKVVVTFPLPQSVYVLRSARSRLVEVTTVRVSVEVTTNDLDPYANAQSWGWELTASGARDRRRHQADRLFPHGTIEKAAGNEEWEGRPWEAFEMHLTDLARLRFAAVVNAPAVNDLT